MSYRVDGFGEPATFDDGTSVLVSGPSPETSERLYHAVVPARGERAIVITTNTDAETVVEELLDRGAAREQLGVIECTNHDSDVEGVPIKQLNSPGDLTGISLEFAKLLDEDDTKPVRVGFTTVSTALMYAELRTMFRFLHVFTARIRSGDMLGVFSMDPTMHDEKAHNTIRAVFDCEVSVDREGLTIRGSGFTQ